MPSLESYGWSPFFAGAFEPYAHEGLVPGRVGREHQHIYRVYADSGEVLAAISSSIADTKPVFDAILASGERALDVAVRLHYGDVAHTVEADPLVAARRVAGAEVHIVASYTQFTRLTKEFW